MQRWIRVLVIILGLQVALTAVLAARRSPLTAATPNAPLLSASVKRADHILIEGPTAKSTAEVGQVSSTPLNQVQLAKSGDKWILPQYFNAPASTSRVTLLLDRLASLKRGFPIATSETALRRFKVADQDFERRVEFHQGNKALDTLYVGSSPGLRKSDARAAADHAVYAVDLATFDLPTQATNWFDGDLLKREPESMMEIDITDGAHTGLKLIRKPGGGGHPASWSDATLKPPRKINASQADTLARDIAQMHVDAVLGIQAKPDWQQAHPLLTLTLRDDKRNSVIWTLSKPGIDDFFVLKSSDHPWYFSVNSATARALIAASTRTALLTGATSSSATTHTKAGARSSK